MTEPDCRIAVKDIIDPERAMKTVRRSPFEVVYLFLEVCHARKVPDWGVVGDLKGSVGAWVQAV